MNGTPVYLLCFEEKRRRAAALRCRQRTSAAMDPWCRRSRSPARHIPICLGLRPGRRLLLRIPPCFLAFSCFPGMPFLEAEPHPPALALAEL
ncbi:hypothetical protein HPB50_009025 [Hyalomma asiaticum]|uniref:Uncharacterized protein n=1 Tax=Hyalomma asiaticum TaxID=266040 RepID=A0ACB7SU44_HYAAI|nr:hypothetical protein HPB50_009025 [Hyalomma asiaticum]